MRGHLAAAAAAVVVCSAPAYAHIGGLPSVALPLEPECAGTVVDGSFVLPWFDRDTVEPEGTDPTLIDLHYVSEIPVTFYPWERPEIGELGDIALDVPLSDPENKIIWDTSGVPTGVYWLMSITLDRDFELVAMAPGPVTVAHPGDPVPPSIAVVQSDSEPDIADLAKIVQFCAHDPDGSAVVKLEVTDQLDGTGLRLLAEGLPASAEGSFQWDTSGEKEGDWLIHATLTDGRGMSASAWTRYFVRIYHLRPVDPASGEGEGEPAVPPVGGEGEGEAPDGGDGDGNGNGGGDGGAGEGEGEGEGSGSETGCCSVSGASSRPPVWLRR